MKFTSILRKVILEQSKYEILRAVTEPSTNKEGKKVKPKMTVDEYNALVAADPTTRTNNVDLATAQKQDFDKIKAGKYVQWLIKSYLSVVPDDYEPGQPGYDKALKERKDRFMEDLYKITTDLTKFEKFKSKIPQDDRDINKLNPAALYDLTKDFSLDKTKASAEEKKQASQTYAHPGGKVVFRGPQWTVIEISDQTELGRDAACFYGGNHEYSKRGETNWCTSSPGYDSHFKRYIKDGPLYVVIPTNYEGKRGEVSGLPAKRYQFHFPTNQFMDVDDRQIDLIGYLNNQMSELKDFFKPEFARGLTSGGGTHFTVDGFSSGATGKFIALYGLTDLIESLPNTIEEMIISNSRGNDNTIIKVPDSISKFQNLQALMFENCIDSVPDSVCSLKSLKFFSAVNNPKLKKLPECIGTMPNLLFLNLKGSDNVVVPESVKQNAVDMGPIWDFEK